MGIKPDDHIATFLSHNVPELLARIAKPIERVLTPFLKPQYVVFQREVIALG